jgi:hypothetical protein
MDSISAKDYPEDLFELLKGSIKTFFQNGDLNETHVAHVIMTDDYWMMGNVFFSMERFPQPLIDADVRLIISPKHNWMLPSTFRIVMKDGTHIGYIVREKNTFGSWEETETVIKPKIQYPA